MTEIPETRHAEPWSAEEGEWTLALGKASDEPTIERVLFPWQLRPMIRRLLWLALVVLAIGLAVVIGMLQ